jgi:cell volume regulation protein A
MAAESDKSLAGHTEYRCVRIRFCIAHPKVKNSLTSATLVFLVATVIIIIGAASNYLFRRTGVPDMLFLVLLGLIFGPVLGVLKAEDIESLAPFLSVLAVVIILFDGGLGLNIRRVFAQAPRAIVLAVLGFAMSATAVALFTKYVLGWHLFEGALLGCMVGGSSSIVVIALVQRLGLTDKCKTTLILESSITDVLSIIAAIALMGIMTTGLPPIEALAQQLTSNFTTGIVLGTLMGLLWLGLLPRLGHEPYRYMLTLAAIFLTYFVSETLGGSGAISALVFGIVLANSEGIFQLIRKVPSEVMDDSFKTLEAEIVFLIKAFFFVYLGLIVAFPTVNYVLLTLAVSVLLLGVRWIAVSATTVGSELSREKGGMTVIYGRGLAAAILSVLPAQYGIPNASIYSTLTLMVIVLTAIITSIGSTGFRRNKTSQSRDNLD